MPNRRLTIKEMEARHPDLLKGQHYRGAQDKYKYRCAVHGIYKQRFSKHDEGHGCFLCGILIIKTKTSLGIREAERRHPDMVKGQTWSRNDAKYDYRCPVHGVYKQRFQQHRVGGCPKCTFESRTLGILEAERRYPDMVKGQIWRDNHAKYWFICKKHGTYEQEFNSRGSQGCRCPHCSESWGEKAVAAVFAKSNTPFEREKRFDSCRNSKPLPFDFYVPSIKTLVEYHGVQHYEGLHRWGGMGSFRRRQLNDRIKKRWARRNKFKLIVVPYTVKNIEVYLADRLRVLRKFRKAA